MYIYRTITAGLFSILSSLGLYVAGEADSAQIKTAASEVFANTPFKLPQRVIKQANEIVKKRDTYILDELIGKTVPDISYVLDRAQCETGINWRNGGRYSGALGIYRGTWQRWGGHEQFGVYDAFDGTRDQQILVWYRVHYTGYSSSQKGFQPSAGPLINNCSEYAGEIKWVTVAEDTLPLWRYIINNTGRG